MKKLTAICTCLLITLISHAQVKDYSGSYVDADGRSHMGIFPGFENSMVNPFEIKFLEKDAAAPLMLKPADIRSVQVGEDFFLSYKGQITANTTDYLAATALTDFDSSRQTVYKELFLRRVLHSANYDLYVEKSELRTHFFLGRDGQIDELQFWAFRKDASAAYSNIYQDQLAQLPGANASKAHRVDYTQQSLARFLTGLAPDAVAVVDNAQRKKYLLLEVGLTILGVKNVSEPNTYLYNLHFGSAQSPVVALGYQYFLNRHNRSYLLPRLSGYGFNYTSDKNSLGFKYLVKSSFALNTDVNIGYNLVSKPALQVGVQGYLGFQFLFNGQLIEDQGNTKKTDVSGTIQNVHYGVGLSVRPGAKLAASLYYSPYVFLIGSGQNKLKQQSIQLTVGLAF